MICYYASILIVKYAANPFQRNESSYSMRIEIECEKKNN